MFRGADVLQAVQQYHPHVVLLDINLPAPNGIECVRQLATHFPAVRAIMLTMYAYQWFIDECRKTGAAAYLLKDVRIPAMLDTIRRVLTGERVFPASPKTDLHEDDPFVTQFKLTPSEIKVIALIRQGLSNPQIGEKLFVGAETIKSHRRNIYQKLNISHVSELIEFARQHGI